MSDTQLLTIAFATVPTFIVVLVGTLFNNSRLGDVNNRFGDVQRRIDDMRDLLRAEMAKNHSDLLSKFAELDRHLSALEARH